MLVPWITQGLPCDCERLLPAYVDGPVLLYEADVAELAKGLGLGTLGQRKLLQKAVSSARSIDEGW
eukprot:SAG22_NODE_9918_length_563_cov_1.338362_1_plen_65_part_10